MSSHTIFVTGPFGALELLAEELGGLGVSNIKQSPGGVSGEAGLQDIYRTCLWSRVASRVLLRIGSGACQNEKSLYESARKVPWEDWFGVRRSLSVRATTHRAAVANAQFAGLKVKDAIVDRFRDVSGDRPDVNREDADIVVSAHIDTEHVTFFLDAFGGSLHRRGYRVAPTPAPLKENLAASLLLRAGWPRFFAQGGAFVDPMCGSGTLLIEAAWMALDVAPGTNHKRFSFESWENFQRDSWQRLREEAADRDQRGAGLNTRIWGYDIDPRSVSAALQNVRAAGVGTMVEVKQQAIADLGQVLPEAGLVVTNPPYGERLKPRDVEQIYSQLGAALKEHFGGYEAAVLVPELKFGAALGMRAHRRNKFRNGTLDVDLMRFHIRAR